MKPEYRVMNGHHVWRFEDPDDNVGQLIMFVYNADEAEIVVGMLNAALAYAQLVTEDQ